MFARAPDFWTRRGAAACALAPLGAVWGLAASWRRALASPVRMTRPVVCVGNLVAGGAGKTPLALALGAALRAAGREVHFLSRGYGGRLAGPLRVDPERHGARDVGDEPLLLAALAPCWIARDRAAGARAAIAAGAEVVVMDDGFQNTGIAIDRGILAVDGGYGFGNGLVMPAGPLREPLEAGLARADAAVIIGPDSAGAAAAIAGRCPVFRARLIPRPLAEAGIAGERVFAFAGIGRPEKFFATLREMGCTLAGAMRFPDHHPYRPDEIASLCEQAAASGAQPVTSEKDFVRLPPEARDMVMPLRVMLEWEEPDAPARLLGPLLGDGES